MLWFLLKRLFFVIPTLGVISALIFLFLQFIPGNFTFFLDEQSEEINIIGSSNHSNNQFLKEEFSKRNHWQLPVFYFDIKSRVALDRDQMENVNVDDRSFVHKMNLYYGNHNRVKSYYTSIQYFKGRVEQSEFSKKKEALLIIEELFRLVSEKEIAGGIRQIESMKITYTPVKRSLQDVIKAFTALKQHKNPYKKYFFSFQWNGWQNQFHLWLRNLFRGKLGESLISHEPVTWLITKAISNTLLLTLVAMLMVFVLALFFGILLNHSSFRVFSEPVLNILYLIDTIPIFLLALFLLAMVSNNQWFAVFPSYGLGKISEDHTFFSSLFIRLYHLSLPMICLVLGSLPYITQQVFTAVEREKKSDYYLTAQAKGLSETKILLKHVLKNALNPIITVATGFLPFLVSGALVIEVIFAIPGIGRLLQVAVLNRDYNVVMGIVLLIAFFKILSNIIADMSYRWVDPRIPFD